jgi:hypothetical protein
MSLFEEEFPDFDPTTMPSIPAGWTDQSWHNDSCPSFNTGKGVSVFVDYADVSLREVQDDYPRFSVMCESGRDDIPVELLSTNDWDEVLAFVAARQ